MIDAAQATDSIDHQVRMFVFETAAATGSVPQAAEIARALNRPAEEIDATLNRLAAAKAIVLASNNGDIWAASPFCAVPSGFRVTANARTYWGICAWDALGIVAALQARSAKISAPCGDCGDILELEFANGELAHQEGLIHFAVPARAWWKNIGFA